MPAQFIDGSPAVQARRGLERARRDGLPFDEAWARVVGRHGRRGEVRYPHATEYRRQWRAALEAAREEFRLAYELRPSPLSVALASHFVGQAPDHSRPASRLAERPVAGSLAA